jgi:hypothetical protein
MDQLRSRLPIRFNFYVCKFLYLLYLFVPLRSVFLNPLVIMTEKTGH